MFTAFRISSTDMSTSTPFLRASTPYTPVQKRSAPRKRNSLRSTELVPPGDDHGAHQGGEEQHRDGLEGDDVGLEDGVAHQRGGADPEETAEGVEGGGVEGVDQDVHQEPQQEQGHGQGQEALVVVQVRGAAQRRPGEHDPEEEEHDDGADVDDYL